MRNIFETLISFPTISGNYRANHEALEYIDHFLSERGLFVERFERRGVESLVATTRRTKTPRVLLAAHLDVVPAPERLFRLTERDGKFYGRGTCDMKFAIAAYLQLIDGLQEDLELYDFGVMITTDEEIGGHDGAQWLLQQGYQPQACLLPDGGDDWMLEQSAKGLLWLTLTAKGTAAHGSRPWEGESAIEKMVLFLQAVQAELFAKQGPETSTINIGIIQGGTARNQIANTCTATVDIRPTTREEQQRLLSRIAELGLTYDVSFEMYLNDSPISIDLADPFVVAYARSLEKITGEPLRTMTSNAGSDARHFAAYDIPTLVSYPPGGGRHSDEEWLDVKSFYQFRDLIQDYVEQTAKLGALGRKIIDTESIIV